MKSEKMFSCLIVDDEPRAREILKRYIEQVPMLTIAEECSNALQALTIMQNNKIDLLFLDVQMPQVTGLELIKLLKNPPVIILTTAYEKYALEAFDLDVADYLLKPIHFDRFLKAVMKTIPSDISGFQEVVQSEAQVPNQTFLYFRADRKMVKVFVKDIVYIESLKDYVKIFTEKGLVVTKSSITALEVMLPEETFVRAHRSYIVNINKITSFTSDLVELEKTQIPVGKLYKQQLFKMMKSTV
jgi:two-component system LytT family response regulator